MVIVNSSVLFSSNGKEDKRVAFNTGLIVDCTRSPSTRFSREAEWAHTHPHNEKGTVFFANLYMTIDKVIVQYMCGSSTYMQEMSSFWRCGFKVYITQQKVEMKRQSTEHTS